MHSPFEKWRLENIPQIGFTADIRELLALAFEGGRKSLEQPAQKALHDSDCAVHNAPAYPVGKCDCKQPAQEQLTDSQCDEFRRLPMSFNDMVRAIYKAGQEALAQPADGIELEWYCKGWDDAEKDLATQEPVGEINTNGMAWFYSKELSPKYGTKLYTTPPSREWVGLSDSDYVEIYGHANLVDWRVARVIEAKLKEKNG